MEKPTEITTVKDISSERLGLMLASEFETAFQCQQNIHAITAELTRRKKTNEDASND